MVFPELIALISMAIAASYVAETARLKRGWPVELEAALIQESELRSELETALHEADARNVRMQTQLDQLQHRLLLDRV